MWDTPPEISDLVGQKYTFIVRILRKHTVKSKKDDPSFEVVNVPQQCGKQISIPNMHTNDVLNSSSSSFLSVPKAPLFPIRSKTTQHELHTENDPMEVEQTGNTIQETLTGSKRPFSNLLSHPQDGTNDNQDDQAKDIPMHTKKEKAVKVVQQLPFGTYFGN